MAIFKQANDGHYFLLGPLFPSEGMKTRQVTEDGAAWLMARGIDVEGRISQGPVFDQLKLKGWVYTGGGGSAASTPFTSEAPNLGGAIAALIRWAEYPMGDTLEKLLRDHFRTIDVAKCFHAGFQRWLLRLEANLKFTDFVHVVSEADFVELVENAPQSALPELHRTLLQADGGLRVCWEFARLLGWASVAKGDSSPMEFTGTQSFLDVLREILSSARQTADSEPPVAGKKTNAEPFLTWRVYDQRIVLVLPPQWLKDGEELFLEGVSLPRPSVYRVEAAWRSEEVESEPLAPAAHYSLKISMGVSGHPHRFQRKYDFRLAPDVLLFAQDGRLLRDGPENPLPSGSYFALVRKNAVVTLRNADEELEPDGWSGWRGYRVQLPSGEGFGSYRIHDSKRRSNWRLECPAESPVRFFNTWPVYRETWPRLMLSGALPAQNAALKLERANGLVLKRLRVSDVFKAVSVSAGCCGVIDLSNVPELPLDTGEYRLSFSTPDESESDPLPLTFVCLKGIDLQYVSCSAQPNTTLAVRVSGIRAETLADSIAEINSCEQFIYPRDPIQAPQVAIRLPQHGITLRIHVPVTRGRAHSPRAHSQATWRALPLDLKFADVGLDETLQVEVQEPRDTLGRQLKCREVDGAAIAPLKRAANAAAFEIPLTRWRDQYLDGNGTLQAFFRNRWIDLVRPNRPTRELQERTIETPAVPAEVPGIPSDAVVETDRAATDDIAVLHVSRTNLLEGKYDAVLDGLRALSGRTDLPEVAALCVIAELRRIDQPLTTLLKQNIEAQFGALKASRLGSLAQAEYVYRRARTRPDSPLWKECLKLIEECRGLHGAEGEDCVLLAGLASLYRLEEPERFQKALSAPTMAWEQALHAAWHALGNHFTAAKRLALPKLLISFPAVWHPLDARFVRVVISQWAGLSSSKMDGRLSLELCREELNVLSAHKAFPALELLTARQYLWENEREKASAVYRDIIQRNAVGVRFVHDEMFC